jgi:hypothetical protein
MKPAENGQQQRQQFVTSSFFKLWTSSSGALVLIYLPCRHPASNLAAASY